MTGELLAVAVGVTTLGTDQSQEVELPQVDLQETRTLSHLLRHEYVAAGKGSARQHGFG